MDIHQNINQKTPIYDSQTAVPLLFLGTRYYTLCHKLI